MTEPKDPIANVGAELARAGANPKEKQEPKPRGEWVAAIPADAPPRLKTFKFEGLGNLSPSVWNEYTDLAGRLSYWHARFILPDGEKEDRYQTLWRRNGKVYWAWWHPTAPKPLYNLSELGSRPAAGVLIVEGEKAANAGRALFPHFVVMTWPGGAGGVGSADWKAIAGRDLVIIPDHDEAGRKAASRIRSLALDAGAQSAGVVTLPAELPEKWDVADAWTTTFGLAELSALIEDLRQRQPSDTIWPRGFEVDSAGLWWAPSAKADADESPPRSWICAPIEVLGRVRDQENSNWGKLIEVTDEDSNRKQIVIQDAEFAGEAIDVRRRLLSAGFRMRPDKIGRDRLVSALVGVTTRKRARLAFTAGWAGDHVYMLPAGPIGQSDETMVYSGPVKASYHGHAGDQVSWRDSVAAKASGNAVLLFALSSAFAAPLLRHMSGEGGGFHLRGASSCGKTTALIAAGSVWGGGGNQGFVQTWRATPNAVESIAHAHNDGPVCFDEIKTLGGDAAGDAAYGLATGQMKGRQNSNSDLRARVSWLVLILSSGEVSLADLVRSGKTRDRVYAGQELRLADLDVEIQRVHEAWSCWQDIHGAASHADFSDGLKSSALKHYGHAGPLFVSRFIERRDDMLKAAERLRSAFLEDVSESDDTGQVRRGAERFALVAVGGELAALLDVVPWAAGEASAAAAFLFKRWAHGFGRKQAREDLQAVREVRQFLERYEHARFRWLKDGLTEEEAIADSEVDSEKPRQGEARSLDLAGWKSIKAGQGLVFHFNKEFWRSQMFPGIGWEGGARALKCAGFLVTDKEPGRLTHKVRIPGGQTRAFYTVSAKILEAGADDDE